MVLIRSIWSIFAGFVLVIALSIITDLILVTSDIMKQPFDLNSNWFIAIVVFYRNIYSVCGTYLTAKLAPQNPMKHAIIGGFIGFVISIVGAAVMWDQPPHWYAISLIITALPSAWIGGKLFLGGKN